MGIIINMVNFDIDMGKIHFSLTSMIVKKKQIQGGGGHQYISRGGGIFLKLNNFRRTRCEINNLLQELFYINV